MYLQKHSKTIADRTPQTETRVYQHSIFSDNRPLAVNQRKIISTLKSYAVTPNHQVSQFRKATKPTMQEPDPFIDAGRKYWKVNPKSFTPGGDYWNSNDSKYKKRVGTREVHATLEGVLPTSNKDNELRQYVRARQVITGSINLSGWTVNRRYVDKWHISIKDGDNNLGGWFGLRGPSALPACNIIPTATEIAAANTIHTNMNTHII